MYLSIGTGVILLVDPIDIALDIGILLGETSIPNGGLIEVGLAAIFWEFWRAISNVKCKLSHDQLTYIVLGNVRWH